MKTRRNILTAVLMLSVVACRNDESWTNAEKSLIKGDGEAMRVLTIYDKADSLVLRTECSGISTKELTSDEYKILAEKMVATVTSPEQDGVGIAGPQVGISRRVWRCRGSIRTVSRSRSIRTSKSLVTEVKRLLDLKDVSAFLGSAAMLSAIRTSTSTTPRSKPCATRQKASKASPP